MDIFAAGALFTITFDFWLMYAFSEKLKIICTVLFDELRTLTRLLTVSVRQIGQFTLTEPLCTASSCINRSFSIIDYDIYLETYFAGSC